MSQQTKRSHGLTQVLSFLIIVFSSLSSFAGCPVGQVTKIDVAFSATVFDKQGHDIERILGASDASFAKLDKTSEYVILKLDNILSPGKKITLYFASYDDKSTTAKIEGSANGSSFFGSTTVSTSVEKNSVDSACITFGSNVRYVKITFPKESGMGNLMLDALSAEEEICFVDLDLKYVTPVCVNASITLCLNDMFNFDSLYDNSNYTFNDDNNSSDGYVTVESSMSSSTNAEDCCDIDKPTELTFRYMTSNVVDNTQGSKSSVTNYQSTNGQDVLIVANGNSSPSDLSDPYFSKVVSVGESFTVDQTNGSWNSNTYFHVMTTNGNTALQLVGFHTSCSAPIVPGDQFGYIKLTGTLVDGSVCGDPNTNECLNSITYNPMPTNDGADTVLLDVCFEKSGAQFCDQLTVIVSITDTTCGAFVVIETNSCKNTPLELCLAEIIDLDSVFGTSDVTLTSYEGTSPNGYVVTSSANSNSNTEDCCDFGKPTKLTFRYEASNVKDNSQPDGKSSVTTYGQTNGNKVLIVANSSSTPSDLSNPYMSLSVVVDESFVLTQDNGSWSSNTYFHIMDSIGTTVIQLVQFHTSCSAPVIPGDRFGYITLLASEIEGVTCGSSDNNDCKDGIVYYPNVDFKGTDAFNLEVCRTESGKQVCETVRVNVVVKDSVCSPGCPDGQEKVTISSTLDAVVTTNGHDEENATDSPDGEFAKLEHDDEFIVLSLREYLQAGTTMDLIIASYGGNLAYGTVQGSYDGVTFGPPVAISTTKKKPLTKTESLAFGFDVQFIKIIRDNNSADKLLIDGASFIGTACRPAIQDTVKIHMCVDAPTTWNLNIILPEGATAKDYTVTKTGGPSSGSYSLENTYNLVGCDLDKPKSFKVRYLGGTCADSDNEQEGDFKCDDQNSLDGFSTVYIIVNDDNDKNKRLTDNDQYFVGNVNLNGEFNIDAALNSESDLPGKVYVWIMNPSNNELLQSMEIKTDCNKPINIYYRFGSVSVTEYVAKNGAGQLSEIAELFKSDYTPNTGFQGTDQVILTACETGGNGYCQEIIIDLSINTIAPVAQNDTVENLPITSGTSVTNFDLLANDSHSGGETLKVQTPFYILPTLSGATVTYDTALQRAVYTIDNPKDGDIDSFTYIVRTECGEDTATAFIAFGGPVPVTWLDFTAVVVGSNDVELNWSRASEENNSHFVVERSTDGENFIAIGQTVNGAGNATRINAYDAVDLNVPVGALYYRIKQIDFDGQFDYTEVRLVQILEKRSMVVYPNPVRNEINIQVNGANGEVVKISNLAGQQLGTAITSHGGFASMDVYDYPNGLYFITIESNLHTEVRKILIQK